MQITTAPTIRKADVILRLTEEEATHLRRFFGDLMLAEVEGSMSNFNGTEPQDVYALTQAIFGALANLDY